MQKNQRKPQFTLTKLQCQLLECIANTPIYISSEIESMSLAFIDPLNELIQRDKILALIRKGLIRYSYQHFRLILTKLGVKVLKIICKLKKQFKGCFIQGLDLNKIKSEFKNKDNRIKLK